MIIRGLLAGLAGGIAWLLGIMLFFFPVQGLLQDPNRQSAKMLAAFAGQPLPRMVEAPGTVILGFLCIGVLWGVVYTLVSRSWTISSWWKRGLCFGALGWALMVPWFEFYLPWNVLREPAGLVLLEMVCWAGVLLLVGVAIAGVDAALRRKLG